MAVIDVNLGSQDQTISGANASNNDTLNITSLGSQTLTVDGVNVSIGSVVGVNAGATPIFNLINGATLTTDSSLLSVNALGGTTYNINDTSTLNLGTPTAGLNVANPTTVNFSGETSGSLVIDNNALLGGGSLSPTPINVTGIGSGDHIGFNTGAATFGSFAATGANSGTLILNAPATIGTSSFQFNITNTDPSIIADLQTNGAAHFVNGVLTPVCFTRGTMISTPKGEVAIEDLTVGDEVLALGGIRTVKWIGYRFVAPSRVPVEHRATMLPIRVHAGALGNALPTRDLVVSPGHHLLVDGQLVKAGALANGLNITQEDTGARIDYFHIELDSFDAVYSGGICSESWADGGNRDYFQNVDVTSLRPEERQRRLADRPGFTLMNETDVEALRLRIAESAAYMPAVKMSLSA